MFAIIRTRWHTRPLSRRAKRRSSAAPGSLRKKYAGIVHPPIMVRLPNYSTISGDHRKPVLSPPSPGPSRDALVAMRQSEKPAKFPITDAVRLISGIIIPSWLVRENVFDADM